MNFRWDVETDKQQLTEVLVQDGKYWETSIPKEGKYGSRTWSAVDEAEQVLALNEIWCASRTWINGRPAGDLTAEELAEALGQ